MKLTYDREADAAYLQVADNSARGAAVRQIQVPEDKHVSGEFILDFDSDGELLGLEILFASDALSPSALKAASID